MNKIWSILKDKKLLKTYLRILKSDLINVFYSKRFQISHIRSNLLDKFGSSSKNSKSTQYSEYSSPEKTLKVAFVVTETGSGASAGDYFTAMELGEGLKKFRWEITFLSKKGPENWYNVKKDVDILISLLDTYDPRKIKSQNSSLVKIAWPRNWFDRWVLNPGFSNYDIILASSSKAADYIENKTRIKPFLLPIATNSTRFNGSVKPNAKFLSDYCFTGSYWNDPREIMEFLEPESIPYKFNLYGKNWEKVDKFKKYYKGFINYSDIPKVYASTKIVIDDANRATKDFGAVNSRVFDALASGTLVLTNGEIGAQETFNGKLPVFKSKKELNELLNYYLDNEKERMEKIKVLQKYVLENHTYFNRAHKLKEILKKTTSLN